MTESYLGILKQLRLLVGFLGEKSQFDWWSTAFYESSSRLFLEPVFSKTSRLAQYHGVLEAARILHDEHLSVGSYHLFRLPEEIEENLHAIILNSIGEVHVSQSLQTKDDALDALKILATTNFPVSIGPVTVGNIKELESENLLKDMAGAYLVAFSRNVKIYPYLVS